MRQLMMWVALCSVSVSLGRRCEAESVRPNVLLIAIDDLNDWVGFLSGHPQIQTPNMDRLAKRGMVFANAHCAAPLCCPSRAAIFSGRQPFETGVYNNEQARHQIASGTKTMTQSFADSGYRTLGTGKILHQRSKILFDEYFGTEQRWSPFASKSKVAYPKDELSNKPSQPEYTVRLNDKEIQLPLNGMPSDRNPTGAGGESFDWGPFDVDDEQMGDGKITSWAIERLQESADAPVFLAVGYYRPHIPLWAPQKYFEQYPVESTILPKVLTNDLDDLSKTGQQWALEAVTAGAHKTVVEHDEWQSAVAAYLACVSFVDAQIGRMIDVLDQSSQADNTLIVLFSDHGWHLGEKQHWGKWTGWERSTRVPLIIIPPQRDAEQYQLGTVCRQPVGLIDLYPTLLDLCGLPAQPELAGESLVPSLKDPSRTMEPEVSTFDAGNYSIGDDRWRLIHYSDGSEELYDHQSDPHEWRNLADDDQYADVRQSLSRRLPQGVAVSNP